MFLLRFVHEFVPSDIARITRLTRDTVDITLLRARAEVKAYLEQPARALEALGGELVPMSMPDPEPGEDDDGHDYLARVREAVFALRHERCVEPEHLRRLYTVDARHVDPHGNPGRDRDVSALPRSRQPPDTGAAARRSASGSRAAVGELAAVKPSHHDSEAARRAAAEHVCRAVRAHRPRLLRVLVNGFEVATHEINGAATRVTQTVSATEPVWLVEVYSEQDVCLASLDVTPLPEAPAEQRATVALADDRRIEIALSFLKPWPTLHLVYEDPAYAAQPAVAAAARPSAEYTEYEELVAPQPDSPAIAPAPTSVAVQFQLWQRHGHLDAFASPRRLAWAVTHGRHRVALVLHAGHARVGGGADLARARGDRRGGAHVHARADPARRTGAAAGHPAASAAETTRAGLVAIAVRV